MTPEHLGELPFVARLRLTWFWLFLVVVLAASALIAALLQQRDYERRRDHIASFRMVVSDTAALNAIRTAVDNLNSLIVQLPGPNNVVCVQNPDASSGIPSLPLTEIRPAAVKYMSELNTAIDIFTANLKDINTALSRITFRTDGPISSTYAEETQWPPPQVKITVMFMLLFTIIIMTIGCCVTMLTSTSSRTVTYSMDTLKVFAGFYIGFLIRFLQ
jgi:hypothetical protein